MIHLSVCQFSWKGAGLGLGSHGLVIAFDVKDSSGGLADGRPWSFGTAACSCRCRRQRNDGGGFWQERERESERARERNGEMDALRKQASRFKEQVAKQQQVRIPRPILPFHYLAAVLFFLLRACSVEPGWIEGIGVE
jgi:hypothetical protein